MRVVALLQELLGLTSERMQISRVMALLCHRLGVSWACLTALSADGEVFQHIGSAYALEARPVTCSFSSCRTSSGLPQPGGGATGGRGPPSRSSSTNSIAGAGSAVEVGMSDPHMLRGSDTSIEAAVTSAQPLMLAESPPAPALPPGGLPPSLTAAAAAQAPTPSPGASGATPHPLNTKGPPLSSAPQAQAGSPGGLSGPGGVAAVSTWPLDWQLLYREKGLRSFACLPVPAANGSGTIIGCLSLGSSEFLDWSCQFWASSMRLITGWAAGVITTTRATARASFYSRLCGAANLAGLARAFAYDMPVFLSDGVAGPGTVLPEVRLALVSSRLQHAVVYAAPLLQVSGRLGLPPPVSTAPAAAPFAASGSSSSSGAGGGGGGGVAAVGGMTAAASGPSASAGSGSTIAGVILYPMSGSGTLRLMEAERRAGMPDTPAGPGGKPAAAGGGGGAGLPALHDDGIECMVLGSTLDGDELLSCRSSSTVGGADGIERHGSGRKSSVPGSSRPSSSLTGRNGTSTAGTGGGATPTAAPSPEPSPVDCVKINTDSTLLMSVLEAGDIMIIKDALQYFGGGRMVARDLALNNTRPATAGTLVILPLLHRCRSLGCVYVFARNEFNLSLSRAAWGDLAGMLSRAVFAQLVGSLRHEWYSVFSEEPQASRAPGPARSVSARVSQGGAAAAGGGAGGSRRVKRTNTANSLGNYSAASSLRPSFDVPCRSAEQPFSGGGNEGGGGVGGGSREAAARVLVAAAQVLEYAGFMPPADREDALTLPAPRGAVRVASRHRIPPAHASLGSIEEGERGTPLPPLAPVSAEQDATVAGAVAGAGTGGVGEQRCPSPGSLSFKLPPGITYLTAAAPAMALAAEPDPPLLAVAAAKVAAAAAPDGLAAAGSDATLQDTRTARPGGDTPTTAASSAGDGVGPGAEGGRVLLRAAAAETGAAIPATAMPLAALQAPSATAAAAGAQPPSTATEELLPEGEGEEEISGSSRELQGWPELVDILFDMHRTRNVSIYLAAYRGRPVAIKMMRSHMSMDGRPGHLDSEALTIAAQQQLSCVDHPNILRVLMVYPLVYEVVAGGSAAAKVARYGGGAAGAGAAFLAAAAAAAAAGAAGGGGGSAAAAAHVNPMQPHGLCLGLGALHIQAHAMGDLLAGAGATDLPGGGVYLTAVLPRREKFKRGLALMLELFPSLSLREALQKRMLLPLGDPTAMQAIGTGDSSVVVGPFQYATSQSALSDGGMPSTPTAAAGAAAGGGGGFSYLQQQQQQQQQMSMLPSLPEAFVTGEATGNIDSSPGLAFTAASNSGGGNAGCAGGSGSGMGGLLGPVMGPSMPVILAILTQVAAGMAALHAAGLAHGELRPENVLLAMPAGSRSRGASGPQSRGGGGGVGGLQVSADAVPRASPPTPRATGVGVSRMRSGGGGWLSQSSGSGCAAASLTETERSTPERPLPGRPITGDVIVKVKDAGMTVVGFSKGAQTVRKLLQRNRSAVLPFLPPEVHRGERFSRSADVYMFGILMWELYTGGVAFSNLSGTPIKLLQTVIADGVRPPWPEGTPLWYQSLASRCWAGNPKQRPSFRRIADKLTEAANSAAAASAAMAAGWTAGGIL